jgi:DNA-binding HxlR family transcriptional regulator
VTDPGRTSLDPDLTSFIESALPSVWALETLLVMRGGGDRVWSADALVAETRSSSNVMSDCLRTLERAGLVAVGHDGHRYQPASLQLADLVERLAATYAERPFSVTAVIMTKRSDALKGFADSFRLGRWKS